MFTIESSKLQKNYFINLTGFQNLLGFSLSGKPFFYILYGIITLVTCEPAFTSNIPLAGTAISFSPAVESVDTRR